MSAPRKWVVGKICLVALTASMSLPVLAACSSSSTVAVSMSGCPTATPGPEVYQGSIRPPVPDYPNSQDVEVATPVPPAYFLATPTGIVEPGVTALTKKTTRFTTRDSGQQVLSFYRESLTRVGWLPIGGATDDKTASGKLTFGYSVESTLSAAHEANPCAPTPAHGLPSHGVEMTVFDAGANSTVVEVEETYIPGF